MLCCVRAPPEEVTEVEVSGRGLAHLPESVWLAGRTLEVLRADGNRLQELPRPLFTCTHLRHLVVHDNQLSVLPPAVRALQHLALLDLGRNSLTSLPIEVRQLRKLRSLHLSGNPLERLPDPLTTLIFLQELFLNDTCLEFLPANFGRLTDLLILELRDNCLVLLPKSLARSADLQRLDIGQNEFTEFPDVVGKLTKLRELWMDCNNLTSISPVVENLVQLIHLEASDNQISDLPAEIAACTQLTDVNLSSNQLNRLPDTIGGLTNLVSLKLDCNKLFNLPDGIGDLVNLEELMLASNFLYELPSTIGRLRKLQCLIVDENMLKCIPPEIGSCSSLTVLSLRANRLTYIPDEVGRLSALKVLNLVRNSLQFLPHSLLNCADLVALWLSENQSKPLVPMQSDIDPRTNLQVLTCFLFPQVPLSDVSPLHESKSFPSDIPVSVRHISFVDVKAAAKNAAEKPGQLRRAPTPYPKELRALAKHARNVQKDVGDESISMQNAVHIKAAKVTPTLQQRFASNHSIANGTRHVAADWPESNHLRNGSIYDNSSIENPYDKPMSFEHHKSYQNMDQTLYSESTDSAYSGYNERPNFNPSISHENYSAVEERVNDIIKKSSQDLYAATRMSDKRVSPLVLPFENLSSGTRNSITSNLSQKNQELPVHNYPTHDTIGKESSYGHQTMPTYAQAKERVYGRQTDDIYDHYARYPSAEYSTKQDDTGQANNDHMLNNISPNSYATDSNAVFSVQQQSAYYNRQNSNVDGLYDATSMSSHHSAYAPSSNYGAYNPHESVVNANNIRNVADLRLQQQPPSLSPSKLNPPPYHIAATYSKQAQFFNSNN